MKVYKMYVAAMQKREQKRKEDEERRNGPGDDDSDSESSSSSSSEEETGGAMSDDEAAEMADKQKEEEVSALENTRVGKKLSEMTTRRVIVLVLIMLFGLPQFSADAHGYDELKYSASFGMEQLYDKWRRWCPSNTQQLPTCLSADPAVTGSGGTLSDVKATMRLWYEKYFLTFVYSHHAGSFAWTLHWIGFRSQTLIDAEGEDTAGMRLGSAAQLSQAALLGDQVLPPDDWNGMWSQLEPLSFDQRTRLSSQWIEKCDGSFYGVRVAVGTEHNKGGTACSLEEELRCSETEYYVPIMLTDSESDVMQMVFAFDKRSTTQLEAGLSMCQTIFICLAVGVGALTFSQDAEKLLLKPIDRMMKKLETIKDCPMAAMRLGDLEFRRHQFERLVKHEQSRKGSCIRKCIFRMKQKHRIEEPMETLILERTIIKLGSMLALCFGETGGEIVARYMITSTVSKPGGPMDNTVDIMVAGRKMNAIFGLCQMRNIDSVVIGLQETALLFINRISSFVHDIVEEYSGSPNKNMGSSYLLAWRYGDHYGDEKREGMSHREVVKENHQKMTDMAIISCVKIIGRVHSCPDLDRYATSEAVLKMAANFHVAVSFGLHCGWAIESIIGSDYKIDASYISPQVTMAHSLQAATLRYGVKILMSDNMVSEASPGMASECRMIDHVVVHENSSSVRLYTVDLDPDSLGKGHHHGHHHSQANRFKLRQLREAIKAEKWAPSFSIQEEFRRDRLVGTMRKKFSPEFFKRFFTAYRNYEAGEWLVARDMFYTCNYEPHYCTPPVDVTEDEWPEDGPTRSLLRFMQLYDFECPDDWSGYRDLPKNEPL
jgi:hypothetical protein